jgi:secondary thiamine-phosphate synthase enzyme
MGWTLAPRRPYNESLLNRGRCCRLGANRSPNMFRREGSELMKTPTMKAVKTENGTKPSSQARPASLQMYLETVIYKTRERLEIINITKDVNEIIKKHGFRAGFVLVHTLHTTTAVFINEFQQALVDDMKKFLERLVGRFDYWRHNDPRLSECYRKNADSHLRAMVLGHTLSLPVANGELAIGNWQSVILAELDGPRERAVQIQVLGVQQGSDL